MNHRVLLLTASLASVACSPPASSPSSTALDGAVRRDAVATEFDVGQVNTASAYLEEPTYADADLARGELLSLACIACHSLRPGDAPIVGPNLGNLFGSPAASKPGFAYSAALVSSGLTWTPRALDAWLAAPATFVPGTSMVFAGYASPDDRRDLIAYLLHATQPASE